VRIGLGNNKVVDVEKLLEAGRWEVALERAIRPRHVRDVVRHVLPLRVFTQQLDGFKETREGARCRCGRPDQDVWRGEVVEEARLLERVARRYCNSGFWA
jgi:hypothetical protein